MNYFGNGAKSYPKEMLEVYSEGRVLRLSNYRRLEGYNFKGFKKIKTKMDKGHNAEFEAIVRNIVYEESPLMQIDNLVNVTLASIAAKNSAEKGQMIFLDQEYGVF